MTLFQYLNTSINREIFEYKNNTSITFNDDYWYYENENSNILINHNLNYKKININNLIYNPDKPESLTKQLKIPIKLIDETYTIKIFDKNGMIYYSDYIFNVFNKWYISFMYKECEEVTPETHCILNNTNENEY